MTVTPAAPAAQTAADLTGNNTRLKLGVYANGKLLETVTTGFVGPRR